MPISQARVKGVPSGDTLILTAVNNPSQERTLSLAFVSAPRIRREGDEPFAFQSREYLRSMAIGKVIQFNVLYSVPAPAKREYGIFRLQTGESFPEASASEGCVKLRNDSASKAESQESKDVLAQVEREEERAKASSKGVWASSGGKIENTYEISDPKDFAEQWRGKHLEAIVERVLTGDRIIARLLLSPTRHIQTMLLIAGLRAPATKRPATADNKEQPAEPFGSEAHQFVEARLLHRKVGIEVLGISPQNQLVCAVNHPNGSIAKFILEAGLARCVDHHSTMLGVQMSTLRAAEKKAKDQRLGIFQGVTNTPSGGAEMDATITRVQTADTIHLRGKSGEEKRASLSSVRQPKPSDPQQAPFQADAKEFLRKKLIGKHVRVITDGHRPANEGFEERDVVTVLVNNKNIAVQLVEAGYASVIRHKRDDDDRSPYYDELLAAEATAQSEQKGMWSPKPPPVKNLQDYSESLQKAKIQSSVLQRQKKIPAVVDFVRGGSRFSIIIPRENAKITFVLSGIRAPRSARNPNEKSEPFGQEAHDFANRRCMQRDVEIDVEAIDKVGGFIGALYINRENFAKLLLEEGLATVHAYSAEQSGNANELFAAEDKAKQAKKGLWHDYDPTIVDEVENLNINGTNGTTDSDAAAAAPRKKDYRDVTVTYIDPTTAHLKLQLIGNATSGALTSLMSSFASFHRSPPPAEKSLPGPPKAGDLVAARFSQDNEWYRARIRRNDRDAKKADVLFIDYGNSETLPWSELRPMTQPQFSTQKLKPQAIDAGLSFLQFPTAADYLAEACRFVEEITAGKQLVASVDAEEKDGSLWVTLFDAEAQGGEEESVNAEIVGEGWAMVGRKLRGWEKGRGKVVGELEKRQKKAEEEHLGMWEYGDSTAAD
ncbi:hypothetical protein ACLMJK_003061 [Lecanora helva]